MISIPALIMNPEISSLIFVRVFCCLAIPLGCMAILMMHHLTGGGWGFIIRSILEAGTRTMWLMAVLYVPMLIGMSGIYGWASPDATSNPVYQQKHFYLNVPFFLVRSVIYFGIWLARVVLNRWSANRTNQGSQRGNEAGSRQRPRDRVVGFAITFATMDLVMSLEPTWYSTIYGMILMVAYALVALSLVVLIARV